MRDPPVAPQRKARIGVALLVLACAAAAIHAGAPAFTDPDALYHVRHAWIYRTQGLFQSEFPWARFSAIGRESSNLWYGFHVLLIPFTFARDLFDGLRLASPSITFACLALVWSALSRLGVRFAVVWTLVYAFATGDTLFRLAMVRPQPISLGLTLLLFAFACEKHPPRMAVLAAGAALGWIHMAFFWVLPVVFLAVAGARRLRRERPPLAWAAWSAVGWILGALARPHPLGGIRLASIQILTWLGEKGGGTPLIVGWDGRPYELGQFQGQLVPLTVVAAAALGLAVLQLRDKRKEEGERDRLVELAASLALLVAFAAMSFAVAQRAIDFLVAFVVVFAALAAEQAVSRVRRRGGLLRDALLLAIVGATVAAPPRSLYWLRSYRSAALDPDRSRGVSLWLRDHAAEGDVVFHPHWDQFAPLFYWNLRCRYVNGHDPIFLLDYDPALYAVVHQLETDHVALQDGKGFVFDAGKPRDLRTVLAERFEARWVLVQKARTPRLAKCLREDRRFGLAFETPVEALYRLLP